MLDERKAVILTVDDHEPERYFVSRTLRQAGFAVVEAATGQEALLRAADGVDLVVLDVKLPDMSGLEVCRRLKADPATASVPVVHLSAAFTEGQHRVEALDGGADGYLTAPVEPPELLATVRALLRARRAEQAVRARLAQQAALAALGRRALEEPELGALLDEAVAGVRRVVEVEYAHFLEPLPGGTALGLRAGSGWRPGHVREATVESGEASQAGYTLLSRQPVVVEDWATETRCHQPPLLRDHGVRSGVTVVVGHAGDPLGVLGVHATRPRRFSADDVHFLQAAANVLASAIQRQRGEAALRRSEAEYRSLFDAAAVANAEADLLTGRFLRVNRRYRELTGYTADELLGMTFLEITHPEDRERNREAVAPLLQGRAGDFEIEKRYVRKDGSILRVHVSATLILDAEGRATRLLGTVIDLTARKRAEEEQRRASEQLRALTNLVPGIVWAAPPDGAADYANEQWYDFTGCGRETPVGEAFVQALHPDDREQAATAWAEAQRTGTAYRTEVRLRDARGTYHWFLGRGTPVRDAAGRVVRWVGIFTDITERKQVEERLSDSEARAQRHLAELEAIYHTAPIGLCVIDRDFRFVRVNEALAAMNGVPAAAHIGRTIREVVPGLAEQAESLIRRMIETGEPLLDLEIRGETPAEPGVERVWIEHWYPFRDAAGRVIGVNITAEEVTERRRMEAELARLLASERAARAEAEAAVRAREVFLARASHELRTPLTSALAAARLLERAAAGRLRESPEALTEMVLRNLDGMLTLVNSLLDLSRLGAEPLDREPVELASLVEHAAQVVGVHARQKGVALRLAMAAGLRVAVDRLKFEQVLVNLLANAVKFTPAGGEVTVEAEAPGADVIVRVRDTGEGLAAADLERVFEPFVQAGRRDDRRRRGTGLGLAICRQIVQLHGGRIWAESQGSGKGASFVVRLPAARAGSQAA